MLWRSAQRLTVRAPIEGRILDQVNALFAEAPGQLYVSAHFSPEARVEGEHLTQAVIDAFRSRLRENTWMTPATRSAALANLGANGFVIIHEITHRFDIQGSQVNGVGVLSNWWAGEDMSRFVELNTRVVEQYDALSVDGARLDGNRMLAENVADLGGIQVAFDALQAELAADSVSSGPNRSDFTPELRFLIAAATVWRSVIHDEALAAQLAADSHAPAAMRAVQPLRNLDAFFEAFEITSRGTHGPAAGRTRCDLVVVRFGGSNVKGFPGPWVDQNLRLNSRAQADSLRSAVQPK